MTIARRKRRVDGWLAKSLHSSCSESSIPEYYPSVNWISHFLYTLRHSIWPSYTVHLNATRPLRQQWSSSLLMCFHAFWWPILYLKFNLLSKLVLNWCSIWKYICKLTKRVRHQLNQLNMRSWGLASWRSWLHNIFSLKVTLRFFKVGVNHGFFHVYHFWNFLIFKCTWVCSSSSSKNKSIFLNLSINSVNLKMSITWVFQKCVHLYFSRGNQACARIANAKRTAQSRDAALSAIYIEGTRLTFKLAR